MTIQEMDCFLLAIRKSIIKSVKAAENIYKAKMEVIMIDRKTILGERRMNINNGKKIVWAIIQN